MLVFPGAHFTYYLLYDLFWRYIDRTIHIEVEFPEYILSLMTILYLLNRVAILQCYNLSMNVFAEGVALLCC
jgi:hypothetical protein